MSFLTLHLQVGDLSPPGELEGEEITLQGFSLVAAGCEVGRTCEGTCSPCLPAPTPIPCPRHPKPEAQEYTTWAASSDRDDNIPKGWHYVPSSWLVQTLSGGRLVPL